MPSHRGSSSANNQPPPYQRHVERVDREIGRRFLQEQDYVFVVMRDEGAMRGGFHPVVDCVCAGRATADVVAQTVDGFVLKFPLLFADQVFLD